MNQIWRLTGRVVFYTVSAVLLCTCSRAQSSDEAAVRVHAQRANEALKAGKPQEAIPEFEALVSLNPGNVDAQANLGVLLYFNKQFGRAAQHLHAALDRQPDLAKIRGLLGLSELALGQRQAALSDLKTSLPQLQERVFARQVGLTLVELQSGVGDHAAAADTAQFLRAKEPSDPEVLYACYRTAADLAGESLLSLSLEAPASGQMQQAIGHELLRVRDMPAAIASFRRAVAADPNLPGIHFELAEALRASPSVSDRAEAEREYRAAVEHNPQDIQSKVRLADLLSERSSWPEARGLYEGALAADPNNSAAAVGLSRLESETGNDAKAAALLERAIAADPTDMQAHFRLSSVYRKLHRQEDARRELNEYSRLKQLKDKLQQVYSTMKMTPPGTKDGSAADEVSH